MRSLALRPTYIKRDNLFLHIQTMPQNWKGFAKLLERYQKGRTTPDEKHFMDLWYDSISSSDADQNEQANKSEGEEMWAVIQKGISRPVKPAFNGTVRWHQNVYFRLLAASLLFMIGIFVYNSAFKDQPVISGVKNEVIDQMVRTANNGQLSMLVKLSDGSSVTLDPGAVLYYPATFAKNERNVFLRGDGFFDIAPDKARPFLVHANNIVTRVVGTSFTIRENKKDNSIEVAVMTGVVEVVQSTGKVPTEDLKNKVVLTPNKRATFYEEGERLIKGLVDQPKLIAAIKNDPDFASFIFKERALSQILPKLEKAYGVSIHLSNENIQNCLVTADLSQDKTLFAQLDILCAAIGADFEVENDMVLVTGTGCETTIKSDNP